MAADPNDDDDPTVRAWIRQGWEEFAQATMVAGQDQFLGSDLLPAECFQCSEQDVEALGVVLGGRADDPLFRQAVLPPGWGRKRGVSPMESFVTDSLDRSRIRVYYKSVDYDRKAHMRVLDVERYLTLVVQDIDPLVFDDWATPAAVVTAAMTLIEEIEYYGYFSPRHSPEQAVGRLRTIVDQATGH